MAIAELTAPTDRMTYLTETLAWAKEVRADRSKPTIALQLADELIVAMEEAIEVEDIKQAQLDRFFGTEVRP